MQVSSLERALQNVCKGIAKDPFWLVRLQRLLIENPSDKYDRIYDACLLDKASSVDMQVSSLERALKNVCKGIAKYPSWLDSVKYN
jgi:hypothetical protein